MARAPAPNISKVVRVPYQAGRWDLLNKYHDVQVGWVRQTADGWTLLDMDYVKVAGPFSWVRKAMAVAQSHEAFFTHGNPGW